MKRATGGPGLAKTTKPALLSRRTLDLVSGSDVRWKALFEAADVMSEGAPRGDDPGRRYYGSTDVLLLLQPERPGDDMASLARAIAADPHVRVRALRLARLEAAQRASGPLDRMQAEVTIIPRAGGIAVHVEVEAPVLPDRRAVPRPSTLGLPEP